MAYFIEGLLLGMAIVLWPIFRLIAKLKHTRIELSEARAFAEGTLNHASHILTEWYDYLNNIER